MMDVKKLELKSCNQSSFAQLEDNPRKRNTSIRTYPAALQQHPYPVYALSLHRVANAHASRSQAFVGYAPFTAAPQSHLPISRSSIHHRD